MKPVVKRVDDGRQAVDSRETKKIKKKDKSGDGSSSADLPRTMIKALPTTPINPRQEDEEERLKCPTVPGEDLAPWNIRH